MKPSVVTLCLLLLTACTPAEKTIPDAPDPVPQVAGESAKTESPDTTMPARDSSSHAVLEVIDGDTVRIEYEDKPVTVRLIGIDTPETKHPQKGVECFGPQAAAFLTTLLSDQNVTIELDESQGIYDRYSRLLAYLWLGDTMINELMVSEGYAFEYTYNLPYRYQGRFMDAQRSAREQKRGLWGAACVTRIPSATAVPSCAYDCNGPDLDCGDFGGQKDAQEFFNCCGFSAANDPMRLDNAKGTGNGLACESLP
ncbi:MAG: Thermonuclease precursor [candidate division WS6 bacterium OLB20]|uniref:Thermonuclease n=1 Tax=candidate division WS6 bacterium OLB20 TaxID=1617426 RepID=A0A136LWF8_9BACT|nr:MAG: Thermonuclease precursor [candidate division WS6 bacterium OLB20]